MILTRKQFKAHFDSLDSRLTGPRGPLWIPESFDDKKIRCQWFVVVPPIAEFRTDSKQQFWDWCYANLDGQCRCFSSDTLARQEWWGFTHKKDIGWWMLRWAQ